MRIYLNIFVADTLKKYIINIKEVTFMLLGIDIGGTKCAVVSGDANGKIKEKIKFSTASCEKTLEGIFEAVDRLGGGDAIGISCGGPLDERRGIILSPPNLPGWDNIQIVDILEKRYGVPAAIRNDANACALAEWKFGAGKGCENMVFMTFGTGLGAGLILNGKLYSGSCGMAGEIGHIRLCEQGPAGYGKIGSFEGFCSGSGLFELGRSLAREYLQRGVSPAFITNGDINGFSVASMADAARSGDKCAREVFDLCATMLGRGLAIISDMLDPEMIIIGSVFARCRDLLEEKALSVLRREALPSNCIITVPALSESIGDVAALAVAADIFENERKEK